MSEAIQGKEAREQRPAESIQDQRGVALQSEGARGRASAVVTLLLTDKSAGRNRLPIPDLSFLPDLKRYCDSLAVALCPDNLELTVTEINRLHCPGTLICQRLSQEFLFTKLASLFLDKRVEAPTTNLRAEALRQATLQSAVERLSSEESNQSLSTTAFLALRCALNNLSATQQPNPSSLTQYLETSSEIDLTKLSPLFAFLATATAIAFCYRVSAKSVFNIGQTEQLLITALEQLVPKLKGDCIPGIRQATTLAIESVKLSTENPEVQSRIKKVSEILADMSSENDGQSSAGAVSGIAERLLLAGTAVGLSVTNVLADLGPATTKSTSTLRDTLREITNALPTFNIGSAATQPIDEGVIARLIHFYAERGTRNRVKDTNVSATIVGMLTNDTDLGEGSEWNLDVFSQVLSEDYSCLDWVLVARRFDFPEFSVRDAVHWRMMVALFRAGSASPFPLSVITSEWFNQSGQLSILENALTVPPTVFSFPVNDAEAADAATVTEGSSPTCPNPQGWASASVLKCLLQLSDVYALGHRVRELFVKGLLSCPEVLLCALVRLQLASATQQEATANGNVGMQMKGELMRELIPLFFKPHHRVQNVPAALRRLWLISPHTVAAACIEAWRSTVNDPLQARLATVVHVIGIIRLLPSPENATSIILNSNKDHEFCIAVAFVMADNDMLQLRQWLNERVSSAGVPVVIFLTKLVSYLGKTHSSASPRANNTTNNEGKGPPLVSIENLAASLQFLQGQDSSLLGQEIPHVLPIVGDSGFSGLTIGDSVKALIETCLAAHPSLVSVIHQPSNAPPSSRGSSATPPPSGSSDDVEEMANSYFQKIYTSEQSIKEVVDMLKKFKTSGNQRENDIFACMIHNLFDEYRFFSKYPEKELRITGILFGMLIQHQLVNSITLGIALRYVLEALRKPPSPPGTTTSNSGKMFRFGMFALEQFKERLHEWPQYCSHIVQIPHLKDGYADLVSEIDGAMAENQHRNLFGSSTAGVNSDVNSVVSDKSANGSADGQKPLAGGVPLSVDVHLTASAPVASSLASRSYISNSVTGGLPGPSNLEIPAPTLSLLSKQPQSQDPVRGVAVFGPGLGRAVNRQVDVGDSEHEAPPDAILDRVQFLINNVTMSNVEQKAQDLKDMLASKYFGWLGHYLVVKRISTQPNFHSVYLAFLDQLGDYGKGLVDAILSSVYLNVGKLLRSPKITTSTSERSLLKNLGSWLGQITLTRNRPILQVMLDCKELLFQGYETGMLIAVTPFVAKILEGAKNSIVFRPPNPWLMGLLSVFRALYGVDDLKMNIKFEVEVLCKNLGVKLEDIPLRTDDLAKRIPPVKMRNPDFNMKSSMTSQPSFVALTSGSSIGFAASGLAVASTTAGLSSPDGKQGAVGPPSSTATGMTLTAASTAGTSNGQFGNAGPSPSGAGGVEDEQHTVIPNLAAYVTINPSLSHLFQQLSSGGGLFNITSATLKRAVPIAVDRAIREIIQPVVERSVTIACITTKEIVTKDFAMESDEIKMRKAAQLMVANLAGSLALVTCREPLRTNISTHLRQFLVSSAGNGSSNGSAVAPNSPLSDQDQSSIEQCVAICATDNLELGCMLIEKAATEKAVRDMDEALTPALSARKKHRDQTGQPFYDMSIFGNGRYPGVLPEPLRPKPGGLRVEQLLVYEAFQRMPRQPTVTSSQQADAIDSSPPPTSNVSAPSASSTTNVTSIKKPLPQINVDALSAIAVRLDAAVTSLLSAVGPRSSEITLSMIPAEHEAKQLLLASQRVTSSATSTGALSSTEIDTVLAFAQGIFKRLYELSLSEPLRLEVFVSLLEALNGCCPQLGQDLGTWATYAPTETDSQRKLHRTVLLLLMRSRLVSPADLDEYLSRSMDAGKNVVWLEFTLLFVRTAVLESIANLKDLSKVIDVFTKIGDGVGLNQQIVQTYRKPVLRLLEELHGTSRSADQQGRAAPETTAVTVHSISTKADKPTHQQSSSISAVSLNNLAEAPKRAAEATDALSREDPPGAKSQIAFLLDSWMRILSDGNEKSLQYVQLLQQHGIGKNDEQTERFFRISTDLVVEAVLKSIDLSDIVASNDFKQDHQKALNYGVIDAYAKLVTFLIRYMNSGGSSEQISLQRISLLNKVLGITARTMMAGYESRKRESVGVVVHWDQRPWFRLMLNLVLDLNAPNPSLDPISYGILSVFGSAFHVVQPLVIPAFAFAWLELISHRMFLSNLLLAKGQKGWALAHQLLIDLFLFLEPHLRKMELTNAMKHLYKGTMRVLLVLLHDFPAFLAGYHLSFCNVIPDCCVQLRNLVLSAFPRGMILPDPFTPNLKIDLLPEIAQSPAILSNVAGPLAAMQADLDSYLKNRQPADFLSRLLPCLYKESTNSIDAPRVNSLVLYVGIQAIARLQNSSTSQALTRTPEIEILQKLMEFDERARYVSLNAIANQLRYPSSHTHYYSCVMLFLFSEAKDEGVKEQVTRVLLERLIVHRPHPWGLLITFIELIKNQRYQFWSHPFTRCATEIEKVFESVARSCMNPGSQRSTAAGVGDIAQ